jgi:hypothetical protein
MRFEPSGAGRTRTGENANPRRAPARAAGWGHYLPPQSDLGRLCLGVTVRTWSGNGVPIAPFAMRKGSSLDALIDPSHPSRGSSLGACGSLPWSNASSGPPGAEGALIRRCGPEARRTAWRACRTIAPIRPGVKPQGVGPFLGATIRANCESLKEVTSNIGLLARAVANDVAFWPKADMTVRDPDVRFRG